MLNVERWLQVRQRSLTHTGPHDHAPSTPVHFRFDFSDSDEEAKVPVEDLLAKARAPVAVPPVAPPPPRLATASPLPSAPPKKKRGWGLIKSAVKRIVAMEHGDGAGAGRRSSSEKPKKALHISDIVERCVHQVSGHRQDVLTLARCALRRYQG